MISAILDQQVKDWNQGQVEKFMRGYAASESTRFASGAEVFTGYEKVLQRYLKKYPNSEAMGKLAFSSVEITVLSGDAALAFGQWRLQRSSDSPNGLFTLLFRKTADGWRIVHDHTSSAAPPSKP